MGNLYLFIFNMQYKVCLKDILYSTNVFVSLDLLNFLFNNIALNVNSRENNFDSYRIENTNLNLTLVDLFVYFEASSMSADNLKRKNVCPLGILLSQQSDKLKIVVCHSQF